jgi:hypothetical protein
MTEQGRRQTLLIELAKYSDGAGSKIIAAGMQWKLTTVSKYLGLLFYEGKVERERETSSLGFSYIYRCKAPVIPSPPSQWQPELRLAAPMIREKEPV